MTDASPQTGPTTRRRLLQLATGAALAAAPALRPVAALAGRQWCRTDPVVQIHGHTAHIYVDAWLKNIKQAKRLATGPTKIVVTVPRNVRVRHVASDKGFGFGYDFVFEEADIVPGPPFPIPVQVRVYVPMKEHDVRLRARFVPTRPGRLEAGGGEGGSNAWFDFAAPSVEAAPIV